MLLLNSISRTPTPTKNAKPTHNFLMPSNDDGFEDFEPPVFEINPKNVVKHGDENEEPENQQKSPKITQNHPKSPASASRRKPNYKKVELSDEDFEDDFEDSIDEIISSDDEDFEIKPKRKSPAKKGQNAKRKSYKNLDGHFSYSSESCTEDDSEIREKITQRYNVKI